MSSTLRTTFRVACICFIIQNVLAYYSSSSYHYNTGSTGSYKTSRAMYSSSIHEVLPKITTWVHSYKSGVVWKNIENFYSYGDYKSVYSIITNLVEMVDSCESDQQLCHTIDAVLLRVIRTHFLEGGEMMSSEITSSGGSLNTIVIQYLLKKMAMCNGMSIDDMMARYEVDDSIEEIEEEQQEEEEEEEETPPPVQYQRRVFSYRSPTKVYVHRPARLQYSVKPAVIRERTRIIQPPTRQFYLRTPRVEQRKVYQAPTIVRYQMPQQRIIRYQTPPQRLVIQPRQQQMRIVVQPRMQQRRIFIQPRVQQERIYVQPRVQERVIIQPRVQQQRIVIQPEVAPRRILMQPMLRQQRLMTQQRLMMQPRLQQQRIMMMPRVQQQTVIQPQAEIRQIEIQKPQTSVEKTLEYSIQPKIEKSVIVQQETPVNQVTREVKNVVVEQPQVQQQLEMKGVQVQQPQESARVVIQQRELAPTEVINSQHQVEVKTEHHIEQPSVVMQTMRQQEVIMPTMSPTPTQQIQLDLPKSTFTPMAAQVTEVEHRISSPEPSPIPTAKAQLNVNLDLPEVQYQTLQEIKTPILRTTTMEPQGMQGWLQGGEHNIYTKKTGGKKKKKITTTKKVTETVENHEQTSEESEETTIINFVIMAMPRISKTDSNYRYYEILNKYFHSNGMHQFLESFNMPEGYSKEKMLMVILKKLEHEPNIDDELRQSVQFYLSLISNSGYSEGYSVDEHRKGFTTGNIIDDYQTEYSKLITLISIPTEQQHVVYYNTLKKFLNGNVVGQIFKGQPGESDSDRFKRLLIKILKTSTTTNDIKESAAYFIKTIFFNYATLLGNLVQPKYDHEMKYYETIKSYFNSLDIYLINSDLYTDSGLAQTQMIKLILESIISSAITTEDQRIAAKYYLSRKPYFDYSSLVSFIPHPKYENEEKLYQVIVDYLKGDNVYYYMKDFFITDFNGDMNAVVKSFLLITGNTTEVPEQIRVAAKFYQTIFKPLKVAIQKVLTKKLDLKSILSDSFDFSAFTSEQYDAYNKFFTFISGSQSFNLDAFDTWTEKTKRGEFTHLLFEYLIKEFHVPGDVASAIKALTPLIKMTDSGARII